MELVVVSVAVDVVTPVVVELAVVPVAVDEPVVVELEVVVVVLVAIYRKGNDVFFGENQGIRPMAPEPKRDKSDRARASARQIVGIRTSESE